MDKTLKRKWVKALLSGEYEQGRIALKTRYGSYCCLGVLGKIAGLSEQSLLKNSFLTAEIAIKGGPDFEIQRDLAHLNDEGVPFDMIAGLIDTAL